MSILLKRHIADLRLPPAMRSPLVVEATCPAVGTVIANAGTSRADIFAATIKPIIDEIRASGITTFDAIAQALNQRGIKSSQSVGWRARSVQRLEIRADTATRLEDA